jgi:hypothetical protein
MRTVLNSVMAVVVVAALFLGNCFSCPQVLLAQQKHGCCPHSKSAPSNCTTQVLQHFVKAEKGTVVAPAVAEMLPVTLVSMHAEVPTSVFSALEYTPPLLRTSLRI